jgi:hypothetical protein
LQLPAPVQSIRVFHRQTSLDLLLHLQFCDQVCEGLLAQLEVIGGPNFLHVFGIPGDRGLTTNPTEDLPLL